MVLYAVFGLVVRFYISFRALKVMCVTATENKCLKRCHVCFPQMIFTILQTKLTNHFSLYNTGIKSDPARIAIQDCVIQSNRTLIWSIDIKRCVALLNRPKV